MILIISNWESDPHVGFLAKELDNRGVEYLIFDPATYPMGSSITIEDTATGYCRGFLTIDGKASDLGAVSGAWYRRPAEPLVSDNMDPADSVWAMKECAHTLQGLYEFIPVERWVSHPSSIRRASTKLWQLRIARNLGFTIPPYILTNDPGDASEFIRTHAGNVVAKALSEPFVFYPDSNEVALLYTHRVGNITRDDVESIRNCPTFLQRYVEKTRDLRVTVVGNEVFSVEIDPSITQASMVDYRVADVFDLPHRVVSLPPGVEASCTGLVRALGLLYGAIDLITDSAGVYYFLEINPNGQWMWIEWASGAPIRRALCDLLVSGTKAEHI